MTDIRMYKGGFIFSDLPASCLVPFGTLNYSIVNGSSVTSGSSIICLDCISGYYQNYSTSFDQETCQPCSFMNCGFCPSDMSCQQCQTDSYSNGTSCVACSSNCLACSEAGTCITCNSNSILNAGICICNNWFYQDAASNSCLGIPNLLFVI